MRVSSAKRQIIAMGGGGFSMEDSPLLDRYILDQTAKPNPKVCLAGTASGDAEDYIGRFYAAFSAFDCQSTHLSLFKLPTRDLQSFVKELAPGKQIDALYDDKLNWGGSTARTPPSGNTRVWQPPQFRMPILY